MGKTSKPLLIIRWPPMDKWEELDALKEQGHVVKWVYDCMLKELMDADLLLSPRAWLMDESHRKYLPLAIAEARRRRYPPTKKESA